jgi:hypothetical protein
LKFQEKTECPTGYALPPILLADPISDFWCSQFRVNVTADRTGHITVV